jgi:hypothetical protein
MKTREGFDDWIQEADRRIAVIKRNNEERKRRIRMMEEEKEEASHVKKPGP